MKRHKTGFEGSFGGGAENVQPLVFQKEGRAWVSSAAVADNFGKRHGNVLRDIRVLLSDLPEDWRQLNFELTFNSVAVPNGATREESAYNLTRDGFTLLAMGFTGRKALRWKLRYIQAFNLMEAALFGGKTAGERVAGCDPDGIPDEVLLLKPSMRVVALNGALRMFSAIGGVEEDFYRYLKRFCVVLGCRQAAVGQDVTGPYLSKCVEYVQEFARSCCVPAPGQRVRAGKVYASFCRWWRRFVPGDVPSQYTFGRLMSRLYTNARRGGNVWYFDMALTGV